MTKIVEEIYINAPKDKVWNVLADLGAVGNYHAFLKNAYYISSQKEGIGASRVCEFSNGMVIEETASVWKPGESYYLGITFKGGPKPPLRDVGGKLSVRESGNGTIVRMEVTYKPKLGLIGIIMDQLMIRRQYASMVPAILKGLRHHVETGERVNIDVLKRLDFAASPA